VLIHFNLAQDLLPLLTGLQQAYSPYLMIGFIYGYGEDKCIAVKRLSSQIMVAQK
jgi:hypothetical protein